jgi:Type I phosphodiesterase / nucleotide pyrophosphatase
MRNDPSIQAVDAARWSERFIRPLYESYCFSRIPALITSSLGGGASSQEASLLLGPLADKYDRLILLFIDGFGWRFFEQFVDQYPFLRRFEQEGFVTKLTSQFPSTTAAHTATIHTGLEVGQSGLYEWFYYEPQLDDMIAPLLFSFAGERERNTLQKIGIRPEQIFPESELYPALSGEGVHSFVLQGKDISPSLFNSVVSKEAQIIPYATLGEGLSTLAELVQTSGEPSYYLLYFGRIDAAGHRFGPGSHQFAAEVDACFTILESVLQPCLDAASGKTLLLLTADHGQIEVDPATTIFLNKELPGIETWLRRNQEGRLLVPAGSARDLFLHVREENLAEAQTRLQGHLEGRAAVYLVSHLIADGFFGSDPPSETFLNRVGNLVILPYEYESVWWFEKGRFEQPFRGHHGGLTRAEMETEVLALSLG